MEVLNKEGNDQHDTENGNHSQNVDSNNSELQNEINKMIERNVVYFDKTNSQNNKNGNSNTTGVVKSINKKSKLKKKLQNDRLKKKIKAGNTLEKKMLEEISDRRKKNKIKREQKKAQKLEGELKVGNMTVIKDIKKIRKCDKKTKNKIFKLSSDAIQKIIKKK
ncbi:conserved Plasmodium protein, unknown function [Plasmodium chabaudi chabaudi]|uniref:Uncharacterized protein n=1 Tax=Plasmodium chabaudi chabaudi TaxID=31271 RepID=A0A1D3LFL8_PLACU|nr:conserved Plasmodium protein, unknown function [Plasmodium chabaudi chabaudi]